MNEKAKIFIKNFIQINPYYFKNIEVGCRDIATKDFFQSIGVNSYFSRCLTLSFPLRKDVTKRQSIFIVDIPKKLLKYIPQEIIKNAKLNKQRAVPYKIYSTCKERISYSQDILELYKNQASLIITSAMHCACPCVAMGIPVIFIDPEESSERFSTLKGIIPIYKKEDLINKRINFHNVLCPNIEELKIYLSENFKLTVKQLRKNLNKDEVIKLQSVRMKIETFKAKKYHNYSISTT